MINEHGIDIRSGVRRGLKIMHCVLRPTYYCGTLGCILKHARAIFAQGSS
jgi:hypothetical protein